MRTRVLHKPALLFALSATLTVSACGGSSSHGAKSEGVSGGTTLTASSIALPKVTNTAQAPEGMALATVPDLDNSIVNVFTSKPSDGALPVTAADGKTYAAPDGKALIAVGWAVPGTTAAGYAMNTTHTISVIAGGKTLATKTLDRNAYNDGGGWILAIPKPDGDVTVRISADGGQQNIPAGTTARDNATSNGLAAGANINAPVAARTSCDATDPTDATAACSQVLYTLTDHDPNYGWAKPGHAFLKVTVPDVKVLSTRMNGLFESHGDRVPDSASAPIFTNQKLDGKTALVNTHADDSSQTSTVNVFDITPTSKPSKFTADVAWDSVLNFGDPGSKHATISVTGTHEHTLTIATTNP